MSNSTTSSSSGGIGVCGLLGCLFVALKLCGVINWSWWWVTAPFWGSLALVAILLLGAAALFVFAALLGVVIKKK
jgi:hypothetical protein